MVPAFLVSVTHPIQGLTIRYVWLNYSLKRFYPESHFKPQIYTSMDFVSGFIFNTKEYHNIFYLLIRLVLSSFYIIYKYDISSKLDVMFGRNLTRILNCTGIGNCFWLVCVYIYLCNVCFQY